jgi:LmbE family N-acetylglucosaminyl deacetylase
VLRLALGADASGPLDILCLGAHSDDIEIGCGGTVLRMLAEHPESRVHWAVLSADAEREQEARASAAAFLADAGSFVVEVEQFRESYFPYVAAEIKDYFNVLRQRIQPDVVFCPHRFDDHQDHRTVAELVWNTFRDHLVLEYEIPKYEGDLGRPNVFVTLPAGVAIRKVELICTHFSSQQGRSWFRPETFEAILTLRGVESGSRYAEAFHARKVVI